MARKPKQPVKKDYFLRRRGTNLVFRRTALLAKRDDMIPISKAEADRRLAAQEDDARERVEATRVWRENGGHGKPPSLQQEDSERASLVADGLVPPEADENPEAGTSGADAPVDPLAELDMAELVALANDKKVPVGEDATEESLRAELKALMSADAEEEQPPAPGAND